MWDFKKKLAVRPAAAGAADLANSQLARTDSQRSAVVAAGVAISALMGAVAALVAIPRAA